MFGISNASRFEVGYERWVFQGGVEKIVQLRILEIVKNIVDVSSSLPIDGPIKLPDQNALAVGTDV